MARWIHGRYFPKAKLSITQVREIKNVCSNVGFRGMKRVDYERIADRYSVSTSTIKRINYGETWSWI